jgi:hypothetical protein
MKTLLYFAILIIAAIGIEVSQKFLSHINPILGFVSSIIFDVVAALYFFRIVSVFKK